MITLNDGVTLPDLPTDVDRSVYPYAAIMQVTYTNASGVEEYADMYMLYYISNPLYYDQDALAVAMTCPCDVKMYTGDSTSSEWSFNMDTTLEENTAPVKIELIRYSDHDIINSETGEVMFASCVAPDPDFLIKESTLKAIGDQARRVGGTTDKLTTNEMIEIFSDLLLVKGVKF